MSQLRVANVANAGGTNVLVNGYPTQPGQIIEYLTSPCDGSSVTGLSGSYSTESVTAGMALTTSYADVTGSSITYTPPAGATKVIYRFNYMISWTDDTHAIVHVKFLIDGVEVLHARRTHASQYFEDTATFEWTVNINGTANANTGRQASWTSPKTLKLSAREYGASDEMALHQTHYWDGAPGVFFSMPTITIIAIA